MTHFRETVVKKGKQDRHHTKWSTSKCKHESPENDKDHNMHFSTMLTTMPRVLIACGIKPVQLANIQPVILGKSMTFLDASLCVKRKGCDSRFTNSQLGGLIQPGITNETSRR